ncbi:MAG TPA: YCF48-related protein, partial [Pyrinomonadaceae bacterium]|nr:YCF48-related protein [Pyrinomonadaceae bacterium]
MSPISNLSERGAFVRRALLVPFLLLAAHCAQPTAHCSQLTAHWKQQQTGTFAWLHSVFFVDESRGWAVGGKGALLSTSDGGERWELRKRPTEDAMRDVFFTDARTGWVVCERSVYMPMRADESVSYLLKTSDGGETWARVDVTRGEDVDVKLAGVRFADASHGWVYGDAGALYATSDGGRTWSRQRVPTRHLLLGAHFRDARRGWLSGAGSTLLQTSDGGATWTLRTSGAANETWAMDRVGDKLWAVGTDAIVQTSTNGGALWE